MLASRKGHDSVVEMLLDDPGVDVDLNATDLDGRTALHHGVCSGNVSIVSRLLIAGV
jgi:ankyrin repeat protein